MIDKKKVKDALEACLKTGLCAECRYACEPTFECSSMLYEDVSGLLSGYSKAVETLKQKLMAQEKGTTVSNHPRWTYVENEVPHSDDLVIVTILDERGDTPFSYVDFGWYLEEAKCWVVDGHQQKDIVAWMPFPEPAMRRKSGEAG